MPLIHADFVQETSATTGTGTYTLAGAVAGFQSFAAIGNANTCYYSASNSSGWEVGIGTYTLAGTLLARTTILASSNGGAAVSWASTINLICTPNAAFFLAGPNAAVTDKAVASMNGTSGKSVQASPVTISTAGQINAIAGTTTDAPLKITTGTLNTTAQAGALEYDGVPHFSFDASARGVIPAIQFMTLTANYTLTSQTAAQKIFNTPANGSFNVKAGTTYKFKCWFALASMSASSESYGFAFGGTATLTSQSWESLANKGGSLTSAGTIGTAYSTHNTGANIRLTVSNTNTAGVAVIEGIVRINAAGTLIPQVSLGIAVAAIIQTGSYCELIPIGITNTVTSEGNVS